MLSQELRPHSWSEMAGQKENIRILKAIIKDPDNAPKCLILQGAFGAGKSTSARILARELNHFKGTDEELLNSQFYYEFDSTVIGNIEEIKRMRDQFAFSYGDYWRVVVLDESQSISNAAQNALLKMLEEVQGRTMFCFCTTDVKKMLPTIRSRSLELQYNPVPVPEIIKNLEEVAERKNITLPDDIKSLIAARASGHMRNAHMLLDKYLLLGEEDFKDSIKSAITLYCDFLIAAYSDDKDRVLETLNQLLNIPKDSLQSDWETLMVDSMKSFCGYTLEHPDIQRLIQTYKGDFNILMSLFLKPWVRTAFVDMPYFQATLLNIYLIIKQNMDKKRQQQAAPVQQRPQGKYAMM